MKSRVLIVVPNDSLGGAEQILKMIALALSVNEVTVTFLTKKRSPLWDDVSRKVTLNYGSSSNTYLGALQFFLAKLLKADRQYIDYIFTSHVFVNGLIGILVRLNRLHVRNFVGRESTQIFKRFTGIKLWMYNFMYRHGYPAIDLLICQTDGMKTNLLGALPELQRHVKVVVIPNPVKKVTDTETIELGLSDKFIVSAGRLIPEKGFDVLIKAFKILVSSYSDIKLVILGEGGELNELTRLVDRLELTGRVQFPGFKTDVFAYFQAAEVCVVSSRIEGFPNVLLQMMSKSTKVVSTDCADGISEIPGIFCVVPDNETDLANGIAEALKSDQFTLRQTFDDFLNERTIDKFLEKVNSELGKSKP